MPITITVLVALYALIIVPAIGKWVSTSPSHNYWNSMLMGVVVHGLVAYIGALLWFIAEVVKGVLVWIR